MSSFYELSQDVQRRFPAHGWAESESGLRHLRMPILQLYGMSSPKYQLYVDRNLAGTWLQFRSPFRTLRHLSIALRDLHGEIVTAAAIHQGGWFSREASDERNVAINRLIESTERSEILLIAILILLRRLPDDIFRASGPILFEKWGSAPQDLKGAIAKAKEGSLKRLNPICDLERLVTLLTNPLNWYEGLRSNQGIRDIITHYPHTLYVSASGIGLPDGSEISWKVNAQLSTWNEHNGLKVIDIVPQLIECVAGACDFMSEFCSCVGADTNYNDNVGVLRLTGNDADVIGFWPPISGSTAPFPMSG